VSIKYCHLQNCQDNELIEHEIAMERFSNRKLRDLDIVGNALVERTEKELSKVKIENWKLKARRKLQLKAKAEFQLKVKLQYA